MPTLTHAHIELNADGVPIISGTTMKIVELVGFHLHQGWDARKLREQFPHLTMAEIYSALSYFHDHETDILEDLERGEKFEDDVQRELGISPLREKLLKARQGMTT